MDKPKPDQRVVLSFDRQGNCTVIKAKLTDFAIIEMMTYLEQIQREYFKYSTQPTIIKVDDDPNPDR